LYLHTGVYVICTMVPFYVRKVNKVYCKFWSLWNLWVNSFIIKTIKLSFYILHFSFYSKYYLERKATRVVNNLKRG
jgi:hypothetical protein